MDIRRSFSWPLAGLVLGVVPGLMPPALAQSPTTAAATLLTPTGEPSGRASLTQQADGVAIEVQVRRLSAGKHGVHVHDGKACAPGPDAAGKTIDFGAAGPHFDPGKSGKHGRHGQPAEANHAGDLSNIEVDGEGMGTLKLVVKGIALDGSARGVLGRTVVVHAAPDDETSQPAGNSGGRVLCGVIEPAQPVAPKPTQG